MKDSGIKTQFLASKPEPAEVKIDEIDYSHVMTTEELQKNYDEYKIVDVRTDEEYEGAILYDEAKGDIFREQFISGTRICSMMRDI